MKAVLMAGGSGTRLRPLTCSLPKPMVPIVNKPIIGHIVDLLRDYGIKDIIVTLHYLPTVIENYLKDGSDFGTNISFSIEEGAPLGTAGCVKNIEEQLDDTFIVISGDALTDYNLEEAIRFHKEKKSKATIVLARVPSPLDYGVVIIDDNGKIERFLEKPTSSEVFSDTVNTGLYILEPEVLKYLPANAEKDFSKDLFPQMLKNNEPMYGYVSEGYWCDVGNLETYRQANYDVLSGNVNIKIHYEERQPGIWSGENVVIEPSARLEAPIVIGNNCYIGKNAVVSANTVLGDNVIVSEEAILKRPVLWNGVYVDKRASLSGCTVGKDTTVKMDTQVLEGAVIGDECHIGQKAVIRPGVRIWPSKNLESGSLLKDSLVWGTGAQKSLFGEGGVKGIINLDITPELAVKVGAAYGATLGLGKSIVVSRDPSPAARLVSRAMFAGMLSVGVTIRNLEETAIPVTRYRIPSLGVVGGIHIRSDSEDIEKVQIEFLDSSGLNISSSQEKKIESTYYKEDFRRALIDEIGEINYPGRVREKYIEGFLDQLEKYKLQKPLKVIVDYAYRINTPVLPTLLGKLGVDAIVLNAHVISRPRMDRPKLVEQLSEVVEALHADFGVLIDADGERLVLIDNKGEVIGGNKLLALMVKLIMEENPGASLVMPVNYPNVVDQIVSQYNGKTIMTKANNRSLMETAMNEKATFAGRNNGKFMFPYFHPGYDAMFSTALFSCLLSKKEKSVSELAAEIPQINYRYDSLSCMTEQKGTVIRILVEKTRKQKVDLLDGIKIHQDDGSWVLVLPDATEPYINMYADGPNAESVDNLLNKYKEISKEIISKTAV